MLLQIVQDAVFAAIAAIGFASISNPPKSAYVYCAIIAAAGHATRYLLMDPATFNLHIVPATTLAALLIGILAVILSPQARVPAETFLYPSLLPMIPGMYAYKTIAGLVTCLSNGSEEAFRHHFYLFASNGITCFFILLGMVIGATLPIFALKKISFTATRSPL